jgi:5-formyltetrahydrofolate cyclo-ligase
MRKSSAIFRKILKLPLYRKAGSAMFFMTHGSEVMTEKIIKRALLDKKKVLLPKTDMKNRTISSYRITSLTGCLKEGAYGIKEPVPGKCVIARPDKIDVVFVPGIAFGADLHRIGYGKGYYDSWLKKIPVQKRIGLSFDFQVLKSVPSSKKDIPMGTVITEKRMLKMKGAPTDFYEI